MSSLAVRLPVASFLLQYLLFRAGTRRPVEQTTSSSWNYMLLSNAGRVTSVSSWLVRAMTGTSDPDFWRNGSVGSVFQRSHREKKLSETQ